MSIFPKQWGHYPPEYNPAVHGYFYPHRYYGKPDTPFGQVKLKDLPAWLSRRKKTPSAICGAISRAFWRHNMKWMGPKKPGPAGILHYCCWISLLGFVLSYSDLQRHRQYRYH